MDIVSVSNPNLQTTYYKEKWVYKVAGSHLYCFGVKLKLAAWQYS